MFISFYRVGKTFGEVYVADSLKAMRYIFEEETRLQCDNGMQPYSYIDDFLTNDNQHGDVLPDDQGVCIHQEDVEGTQAPSVSVTPTKPAKKPRLLNEQQLELSLMSSSNPDHSPDPHFDMQTPEKEPNFLLHCPGLDHTVARHSTSEMLSGARRKEASKAKKRLEFSSDKRASKPTSFSLPKLHRHLFGHLPKVSHGAEEDVSTLVRVCAAKATSFIAYVTSNAKQLSTIKKMW